MKYSLPWRERVRVRGNKIKNQNDRQKCTIHYRYVFAIRILNLTLTPKITKLL